MKIALFISSLESGGAERALSELANYWSEKGHDVHLFLFAGRDTPVFYPLKSRVVCHFLNVMTPENCGFVKRYASLFRRIRCLRQAIKELSPDFVLSFLDLVNIQVILASLGLGHRVTVCERTNPFIRPLPTFYKTLRRLVYPLAASVIVQTQGARKYFSYLSDENIRVIPNVLRSLLPLPQSLQNHKIISVGRLCYFKGFDLLVRAFANLHEDFPDYFVEIYGEGSERNRLENLIKEKGLEDKIVLKGVSNEIEKVLQKAHLFVFPSRFEGFPNALTEALAMGLPCLSSDTSGCADLIDSGKNGLLFKSGDVDSLTKGLSNLLANEAMQKSFSEEAVKVRERLAPEVIYPLWDALLPHSPD